MAMFFAFANPLLSRLRLIAVTAVPAQAGIVIAVGAARAFEAFEERSSWISA